MALNMTKEQALTRLAKEWMGVPVEWMDSLIKFESGWNPKARNPYSGARGLIQFMPSTAKALGYKNADEIVAKYPDIPSQLLGPVAAYFQLPGNRGPYPTKQSLYMTVFYPAARKWDSDTVFSNDVRSLNPGIDTVQDYIDKVEGRITPKSLKTAVKTNAGPLLLLLSLGAAYFIIRKYKLL